MSDYYDPSFYHRWEPLAEFHFNLEDDEELYDDNYFYCLCSRVLIRDGVKTYYVEKEEVSESDMEVLRDSQSNECDDQSHVHFSVDTSYKVKCEKDEGASCYCSASHTDNYCSTDEHDMAQPQGIISHPLQLSDSGADLTYQDCHDYSHNKLEKMDQDLQQKALESENYMSENTWDKFWGINGERLIWASWIDKYSDYINPAYLDENNDLVMDDNNVPKEQFTVKQVDVEQKTDDVRERKFSYDSKVNPYRKSHSQGEKSDKTGELGGQDNTFTPIGRRRSCSEHERMLSPRTLATTDSMTNVTKLTLSSYDVTSSHVTSESTPSDDYSVSSSTSDEQNDQTKIANIEEISELGHSEEIDTENYWQLLWKKHFGEQYALHYANYIESHNEQDVDLPLINIEVVSEKKNDISNEIECENSEGNSQETNTVIEVQTEVEKKRPEEKKTHRRKKNSKSGQKYLDSVGVLLKNLLMEEHKKNEFGESNEVMEAGGGNNSTTEPVMESIDQVDCTHASNATLEQAANNTNLDYSFNDGDDDPPEEIPLTLKRSHEMDEEEMAAVKIKNTLELMGFYVQSKKIPKGLLVYRKKQSRLHPPRYKKIGVSKKTYFDDDGYPYQAQDSQDEREMQTDDDCPDVKSESERLNESIDLKIPYDDTDTLNTEHHHYPPKSTDSDEVERSKDLILEAAETPLPPDLDISFSDAQDNNDDQKPADDAVSERKGRAVSRRRRPRPFVTSQDLAKMPPEMNGDPMMYKYWMKRLSLLHRYDEGCKLDLESWFSITPENVARHIAEKCAAHDVVLDAFCGAGGNTIQFARTCKKVIAVDIDPNKIELAKHNATIYGVLDNIEFVVGDFFELAPTLKADIVFLSPPWGGPNYSENYHYDLETMLQPRPASELMRVARAVSTNLAFYLPRNTKADQLLAMAKQVGGTLEIEQNFLDKRFVAITAFYSEL